ncbi:MAG: EAL domain-containing protein [Phormidesmis sp.]
MPAKPLSEATLPAITKLYKKLCKKLRNEPYWLTSIAITCLLLAVREAGGLQSLELIAFDNMIRIREERGPDPRLLIVEVTEEDIRNQNEWPLSDQTMAKLLNRLQANSPKVIGLDIYRDIPQGDGQADLAKALRPSNVVTITSLGISESDSIPPPPNMEPAQVGFNDFIIDPDGILRRSFLFASTAENEQLFSFALQISLKYLSKEKGQKQANFRADNSALYIDSTAFLPLDPNSGGYDDIDSAGYQMLMDYRSSNWVARKVTLTEVLKGEIDPGWVEDKIVLIGVTAPSIKDFFYTPFSAKKSGEHVMPGVIAHAQIVSQILSSVLDGQRLFGYWPQSIEVGWIWIWALAGGFWVWRLKRSVLLGVVILASLFGLAGACFISFSLMSWIPFAAPAIALLLTSSTLITYQVFYKSFYDPLTGLPNRSLFVRQTRRALQESSQAEIHTSTAVLLLDLDHFKAINESFGHQFGDRVLLLAADRISAQLPSQAKLARIGGDEFAVLLRDLAEASQATKIADALYNQLTEPFEINGESIKTSPSIGIALSQFQIGEQAETLMQDAHRAMARARALGKEHYEIFDPGMRTEAIKRFHLEAELRLAISKQEFLLYYQPIIHLKTGRLSGFEALVRWQHPQQGFVSPGAFIPAAEESGLIVPLGSWILKEACTQMQHWHEQFPQAKELMVSVNLSTKQFNQANLTEEVSAILSQTGLDSQYLKLELTESAAMEDVTGTIDQLVKLKALNLKLSLDDFGTGYSSLSYLHQLPTDTLKVDQSFVGRMENQTSRDGDIVKTIIALGHQLGMDVIAEGIETAAQLSGLRELNCNYGQGYFFAKPLSEKEATALVAENKTWA